MYFSSSSWKVTAQGLVALYLCATSSALVARVAQFQLEEELVSPRLIEVSTVPSRPPTPSPPEGLLRVGKVCVNPSLRTRLVPHFQWENSLSHLHFISFQHYITTTKLYSIRSVSPSPCVLSNLSSIQLSVFISTDISYFSYIGKAFMLGWLARSRIGALLLVWSCLVAVIIII